MQKQDSEPGIESMNSIDETGSVQHLVQSFQGLSVDDDGAETLTINYLPNEILLQIFRLLHNEDLLTAEQVCKRWKTVVEECIATEKHLSLVFTGFKHDFGFIHMKRYGPSIQTLKCRMAESGRDYRMVNNWAEEISDRFPKLLTLELFGIRIPVDDFKKLSTKCSQLTNVTLGDCRFTARGIFLQALPEIKVLNIVTEDYFYDCDIEEDSESETEEDSESETEEYSESETDSESETEEDLYQFPPTDVTCVFSTCRSLHTFTMTDPYFCSDTACFFKFCKECVTLRKLNISFCIMPKEMFAQIQHCSLLEELQLDTCQNIDDSILSLISKGCTNLRSVFLSHLLLVSEEGLKCFARCTNLNSFWSDFIRVTDETLVELSNCVNLRKVKVLYCSSVSDRGCVALLDHCPQLQLLDVHYSKNVSNATVDAAIEAVECRRNGLVLQLKVGGSTITPLKYENCHPLLRLKVK